MRKPLLIVTVFAIAFMVGQLLSGPNHGAGERRGQASKAGHGGRSSRLWGGRAQRNIIFDNTPAGVADPRAARVVARAMEALRDGDWEAYRSVALAQTEVPDRRLHAPAGHNPSRNGIILIETESWLRAEFEAAAALPALARTAVEPAAEHTAPQARTHTARPAAPAAEHGGARRSPLRVYPRGADRWQVDLPDARGRTLLRFNVLVWDGEPRITQIIGPSDPVPPQSDMAQIP
jgi:hypothetical protein